VPGKDLDILEKSKKSNPLKINGESLRMAISKLE
jgi:hypothetical protein